MTRPTPAAVVRGVPSTLARCELTHIDRAPIDVDRAHHEHATYVRALRDAGLTVIELPADEAHPDCVFIEDVLLDVGGVRVLTRPGAASRRGERAAVADAFASGGPLSAWGPLLEMPEGLTLDGGDVLAVRDQVFVGLSSRTDAEAARWLAGQLGRPVVPVDVDAALHLKTAVTALSEHVLILDPDRLDPSPFRSFDVVLVAPDESAAANCLRLPPRPERVGPTCRDERVLMPAGCPTTAAAVRRWGVDVIEVALPELSRAEAGLTCLSVLLAVEWTPAEELR